ncbi:DMT family transporter [Robertmurraya korlensis]|uniref:DMT family transporter n=1 Tax=Robertmurraya korlensis TaxID=519977 RepID=UPI000826CEB7|nr:EamA family transporter [Robertmurraya korlensis]
MHLASSISIGLAAFLWGLLALFVRELKAVGFTAMEIVTIRVGFAFLFLLIIGLVKNPEQLKIRVKDTYLFIGTGIVSIVFFNWCYFTSINEMNVSLAVILLYTSPAFVCILSFVFLKEKLNRKKLVAVIGTIIGCVLIAGLQMEETTKISTIGLIIGLGSGLGYALYSIFGKLALQRYAPFTVTFYTFLIASLSLVPTTALWTKSSILFSPSVVWYSVGLALVTTVTAYFLYTWGLKKTESSKAAIIATIEPVVATLLGLYYYDESLSMIQLTGGMIILASVILVSYENNNKLRVETTNSAHS